MYGRRVTTALLPFNFCCHTEQAQTLGTAVDSMPLMGMVETSENFEDTMEMSDQQVKRRLGHVAADPKNAAACASIRVSA